MTSALVVFAQPEAEVEAQLDQVGDMKGFGVGGDVHRGHNGLDNSKGYSLLFFDRRVLGAIGFKLVGEAYVQSGVGLGIRRLSRVWEAIQEVGRRNRLHA